ncbi:MAG: response regulator [Deltaproteobacteria bacterium]|nr:response regulator [Deltaproteobacteria bacterium]
MSMLLIVDDLKDYCDELAWGLGRDGHQVNIATNAQEAIRLGAVLRPDVLITDWMLEDHIHGLSVSEALRAIRPSTKTILMTGYASGDLRSEADDSGVGAFLEKPFPLSGIRAAVKKVEELPDPPEKELPIAFMEVESSGGITYLNTAAIHLLTELKLEDRKVFAELFRDADAQKMEAGLREWIELSPVQGEEGAGWQVRGREYADRGLRTYVLLPASTAPYMKSAPLVSRLLGLPEVFPRDFQYAGHVLVVDDVSMLRKVTAEIVRQTGGICLSAADHAEAIHLFAHDARIAYVLLDYDMPDGSPHSLVQRMMGLRPQVKIIGCSGGGRQSEFEQLGVSRYLAKPWQVSDLLEVLKH